MIRRPTWTHVTLVLGVIAAVAIAAPVFGLSGSIKKAIKKEVRKQVAKVKVPTGAKGAAGLNGTARAYARVKSPCTLGGGGTDCPFDHAKGITRVVSPQMGRFCVFAPGVNIDSTVAVVSFERTASAGFPVMSVEPDSPDCGGAGPDVFQVEAQEATSPGGVLTLSPATLVTFTIAIP
jgi:hypothetical protein